MRYESSSAGQDVTAWFVAAPNGLAVLSVSTPHRDRAQPKPNLAYWLAGEAPFVNIFPTGAQSDSLIDEAERVLTGFRPYHSPLSQLMPIIIMLPGK
jgi:hypothetical protein